MPVQHRLPVQHMWSLAQHSVVSAWKRWTQTGRVEMVLHMLWRVAHTGEQVVLHGMLMRELRRSLALAQRMSVLQCESQAVSLHAPSQAVSLHAPRAEAQHRSQAVVLLFAS